MLAKQENITITGKSIIDGVEVCGFQATLKTSNPEDVTFSSWQIDKAAYKANRTECRNDENEFEDYVFSRQDELIAEYAAAATEATE